MEIRDATDFEIWSQNASRQQRLVVESRVNLRLLPHTLALSLRENKKALDDFILVQLIDAFSSDFRIYAGLVRDSSVGYGMALAPTLIDPRPILDSDQVQIHWREAQTDCEAIEEMAWTSNLAEFAQQQLWYAQVPRFVSAAWKSVEREMIEAGNGWGVWIDWYRNRIENPTRDISLEDAMHEYMVRPDLSNTSTTAFNAGLRRIVESHTIANQSQLTSIGNLKQRNAILKTEWREGLVHRVATEPGINDEKQAARLAAAWQALRDGVADLRLSHAGGNWPRLERALGRYAESLGEDFEALNVIAIGVHGEKIIGMAGAADEFLMADAAEELSAIARAHGPFIAQFEEWQAYLNDAQPEPTDAELALARDVARALAAERSLVAGDVAEPLETLADDAEPMAEPDKADKRELINGVRNTLAAIFTYVGGKLKQADEGLNEGIKAAVKVAAVAGTTYLFAKLTALGSVSGGEFGWLSPWLAKLASLAGK